MHKRSTAIIEMVITIKTNFKSEWNSASFFSFRSFQQGTFFIIYFYFNNTIIHLIDSCHGRPEFKLQIQKIFTFNLLIDKRNKCNSRLHLNDCISIPGCKIYLDGLRPSPYSMHRRADSNQYCRPLRWISLLNLKSWVRNRLQPCLSMHKILMKRIPFFQFCL